MTTLSLTAIRALPPARLCPTAYVNRGNAKNGLGRHDDAIADYNQATRLHPDGPSLLNRGNAKGALGQHDEAIADYDQAIHLQSGYAKVSNRGNAKSALGQHDDAIADYDQAIRLQPNEALRLKGHCQECPGPT